MAETPEARWQRLERQAARDRQRRAEGFCRVSDCGLWVITQSGFRLSVDSQRPELGQIDTFGCPKCETRLVSDNPRERWRPDSCIHKPDA